MKTSFLIFLLLFILAGTGIKAKACDLADSHKIKLVNEAGEKIHLASQSVSNPKELVSHFILDCKKTLLLMRSSARFLTNS